MTSPVLRLASLSKRFKLYNTTRDRFLDLAQLPPGRRRYREFYALRDVTLQVDAGESVGIIGPNGAGKSTLLKIVTGILQPTTGQVEVRGKVLSLLELGTGFAPELTGRQNIEQSALMLGVPRTFLAEHLDEIRAFADLGDYFDRPLKFYSSGMLVRLAFSLFSTLQPDLFLLDEALGVGDLGFSARALGRIRDLLEGGTTLVLVSHDLQLINQMCARAIWIQAGTVQMDGLAAEVTRAYEEFMVRGTPAALAPAQSGPEAELAEDGAGGLVLGGGWYALEAFGGEVFRWTSPAAELIVTQMPAPGRELVLDVEVPGTGGEDPVLEVADDAGHVLARADTSGRQVLELDLPQSNGSCMLLLRSRTVEGGADGRALGVRVFGWAFGSGAPLLPIGLVEDRVDTLRDLDLTSELGLMERAIRRSPPAIRGVGHIARVTTSGSGGSEAVRFGSADPLRLEVVLEAEREFVPAVSIEVCDAFGRLLWATRVRKPASNPVFKAGERFRLALTTDHLGLGRGVYQISVALYEATALDRPVQTVGTVWRFEVIDSADAVFKGIFDLGWEASVALVGEERGVPTLSRI
jgi:ABC-type polysaccharide/polyol phosphate transport system ATPase subunit